MSTQEETISDSDGAAGVGSAQLAIVIVNYRTPELTIDCLKSLATQRSTKVAFSVSVVDGDSQDDSVERLTAAVNAHGWQHWIQIIQAPRNGGFSYANNLGIDASRKGRELAAVLLLNSDTIVRPGTIDTLLETMQTHPKAGIIAPRLEWPSGERQGSCFQYISPLSEFLSAAATGPISQCFSPFVLPVGDEASRVERGWVSFAAVLIRNTLLEKFGPLDERFFMYFEDVAFCRRVQLAGFDILYQPHARIVHLRGGSSPVKELTKQRKRRPRYYYESRTQYFKQFYGPLGYVIANVLWTAGRSIALAREIVGNKNPHSCQSEARDIWIGAFSSIRKHRESEGES